MLPLRTQQNKSGIGQALVASFLFAISIPVAKFFLNGMRPQWLAASLYLGSGAGLALRRWLAWRSIPVEAPLQRSHIPYLAGAILCGGVLAPVLLLVGLANTPASSAALLLNFEGVFTGLLAWIIFRENLGGQIALGMGAIVAAGVLLSWNRPAAVGGLSGPAAIVAACLCWALDNNLTQKVSDADPVFIAMVKGIIAGSVNALIAAGTRQVPPRATALVGGALLGFVSYGLSLVLYIRAQRALGTARAGNYFSTAPFFGAALGIISLGEPVTIQLAVAALLMAIGVWLHFTERHEHRHVHDALRHDHTPACSR
jgi:drug/metabolite transporter (DMT)-like permease